MEGIGWGAFQNCRNLSSVTFPPNIWYIEPQAFEDCNLESVVSLIEEPFAIQGKSSDNRTFSLNTLNNATLYVPVGTIDKYKATEGWKDFLFIEEVDFGGGSTPEEKVCAKPTIYYQNGKLSFKCETEGVEFVYEIKDNDVKAGTASEIDLSVTYNISVYAAREGYQDSEIATATLCWIEVEPQKEGITDDDIVDAFSEAKATPVLIQSDGNTLTISGAPAGTPITIYDLSGRLISTAKANEMETRIEVGSGTEVVIVKVGEKTVKVAR